MPPKNQFRAFLSHKYNSPEINLYFFDLFRNIKNYVQIEFGVDVGLGKSTSVTRLERMIGEADAFIGFLSVSESFNNQQLDSDILKSEGQYFRLEIDIALRFKKPMILVVDNWFGSFFTVPPSVIVCPYNHQAILSNSKSELERFKHNFEAFCQLVISVVNYTNLEKARKGEANAVGFIIPDHPLVSAIYDRECQAAIQRNIFFEISGKKIQSLNSSSHT